MIIKEFVIQFPCSQIKPEHIEISHQSQYFMYWFLDIPFLLVSCLISRKTSKSSESVKAVPLP